MVLNHDLNLQIFIFVANWNSHKKCNYVLRVWWSEHRWVKFYLYLETIWTMTCLDWQFCDKFIKTLQICSVKLTFFGNWSHHYEFYKILQSISWVISQTLCGVLSCLLAGIYIDLLKLENSTFFNFPNFQRNLVILFMLISQKLQTILT